MMPKAAHALTVYMADEFKPGIKPFIIRTAGRNELNVEASVTEQTEGGYEQEKNASLRKSPEFVTVSDNHVW
jgi:hypothetical protein